MKSDELYDGISGRIKRAVILIACCGLLAAIMGCGAKTDGNANEEPAEVTAPAAGTEAPGQSADVMEGMAPVNEDGDGTAAGEVQEEDSAAEDNPYEVAGIENPKAFLEIYEKIREALAAGDKEALADLVLYPLNVGQKQIKDKADFLKNYDKIITASVIQAVQEQKTDELFVNYQGVMAGDGQMWFGATADTPQKYGIIAVNP
jgi:hypothetical protein